MKIALGSDHRGVIVANSLVNHLRAEGHQVDILGECSATSSDYPDVAWLVGRAVGERHADRGILICGTGIGMCIAANKVKGVRAAVVHDELSAEVSRTHNDANILCLSADLLGQRLIEKIAEVWLATPFQGGRHARRLEEITLIEDGHDPLSK